MGDDRVSLPRLCLGALGHLRNLELNALLEEGGETVAGQQSELTALVSGGGVGWDESQRHGADRWHGA